MAGRTELFVKQAQFYARSRPTYPASLFERLAAAAHRHDRAWDCATGNGQAATMLAQHFASVVATDISHGQLAHATPHPAVTYGKMSATPDPRELECTVGPADSVDIVTVAQALHWFDLDGFYATVRRVLRRPAGILAAWSYKMPRVSPAMDAVHDEFYRGPTAPCWDKAREIVDAGYETMPFPFEPVDDRGVGPHKMSMEIEWDFEDYLNYWKSCSAVQTALDRGINLLTDEVKERFLRAWGPPELKRQVRFPVVLLIGRVGHG